MRIYLTGATGFVGSNLVRVLAERHGATLHCPVRATPPPADAPYTHETLDLAEPEATRASVEAFRPDAIVHCAAQIDLVGIYADRARAWGDYVGATRNLVDAGNALGAKLVLISTDWVFDGTRPGATEREPPNPINLYGFLKAASELVVTERARDGAIARIAGVNGTHWARRTERKQDVGFGYFIASIVDALGAGQPYTVWESRAINTIATPTLASDCAELVWRMLERDRSGIHHCVGGEAIDRRAFAHATAEAFDLDASLLRFGPPEPAAVPPAPVPYDTSLDARATAAALEVELPGVREILRRFRVELETGELAPAG